MNKKFSPKDILVPTISLFVIAMCATFLLALVNNVTADRIAAATAAAEAEARQTVFPDAANFVEQENYYEATDAKGNIIGYVFNTASKGYGGDVPVTVGIDSTGTITGIVPGDLSNETPGLGQNASKPSFLAQFPGKAGTLTVVKNAPGDGEIQAMTSATITTNAVVGAVNAAMDMFNDITGGGK
ncbi:MAG: FMN-binding protein [Clostridia bacterium]|nr:FMN-binding protein [Clostridia bacterium]MBR5754098.1 FMN-binding protein [Clostridia bacterium]